MIVIKLLMSSRFFKLMVLLLGEGKVELYFQPLMNSFTVPLFKPTYDSGD